MDKRLTNKKYFAADIMLFMVAAIWGGGFVTGKMALGGLSPEVILMYRFCGSAAVIGLLFFKKIRNSTKEEILYGSLLGTFLFFSRFVQLFGLQYTTAAKQSFIAASYVAFTPFVAWIILKTRPKKIDVGVTIVALLGIALISLNSALTIQAGDFITLVFAVIFSAQIVFTGKFVRNFDVLTCTFYQFVVSGILAALLVMITGAPVISADPGVLFGVAYLTLLTTTLATCLQNFAQQYAKESHVALILSMESVFGFLFAALLYGDPFTPQMLLGGALVVSSVFISNLSDRSKVDKTSGKNSVSEEKPVQSAPVSQIHKDTDDLSIEQSVARADFEPESPLPGK